MLLLTLREKQKRSTQIEVVKTAMKLFAEHGFDNVPVELICEHAGVSRATFFNYFPQKQMILAAVGASRIEAMQNLLERQIMARRKVKLQHVFSLFLEFCEENEQVAGKSRDLMLQVLTNPLNRASYADLRRRFTETLAQVLGELKLRGNAYAIAGSLFSLYVGTTLEWLMDPSLKRGWLSRTMESRLRLAADGFEPGGKR